ncbi:MAG TPA: HD domain-containing phosphohydrolase [Bryobacteraceae bacterium]|jgi:HD-GYP domain-containing protein (c-di-GMP phosphodiesterase class II)|nr:HD domain-containing phosphohydrolase [Bryobacteraceae bacterium]
MLVKTAKPPSLIPRKSLQGAVRMSEIISALSYALDLTEGRPMGHSVRACMIGMRLAQEVGMSIADQCHLYYSLLLKDAGCSSNSSKLFHILSADEIKAKRDVKLTDWTRVGWESLQYALTHVAVGAPFLERVRTLVRVAAKQQTESCELVKIRCERGASIARRIGFAEPVAQAIHSLDEHWGGGGYPDGLKGREIPLFARIMNLAQTLEVFLVNRGPETAIEVVGKRSGKWFDPDLVRAVKSLAKKGSLWAGLDREHVIDDVLLLEPEDTQLPATDESVENICQAFAEIIDAKTPFTYRHSNGVAAAAVGISRQLGLPPDDIVFMRRVGLLHDVGKLSVSNAILEKPAKLDESEWQVVKKHPGYSFEILKRIPGFEELSDVAGAHHEKLDGTGYFRGWDAERLSLEMRIVAVADIFDALAAKRPYRDAMPLEEVFRIMRKDAVRAIDADCLEALMTHHAMGSPAVQNLLNLSAGVDPAAASNSSEEKHETSVPAV